MAVRTATSDPAPSTKPELTGYDFFYYNKQTSRGGECTAVMPRSLRGIVRKGFIFDDSALRFDPELGASILELDFDGAPENNPVLPPESGWGDPDHLTALHSTRPVIPNRGHRPPTVRKHEAAERSAEAALIDEDLRALLDQATAAFNYVSRRIGVLEKPRSLEAQKLLVTCMIPWLKERGVRLDEQDEKAIDYA